MSGVKFEMERSTASQLYVNITTLSLRASTGSFHIRIVVGVQSIPEVVCNEKIWP